MNRNNTYENELRCPKCGEVFKVSESDYAAILKQVKDKAFEKEKSVQVELEVNKVKSDYREKELNYNNELKELQNKIKFLEGNRQSEIKAALAENKLEHTEKMVQKDSEIERLKGELKNLEQSRDLREKTLAESYEKQLREKEEIVEYYKDLKARMSTKMLGETLEQHCQTEFNRLRSTGFRNAYFEKDNDVRSGSKGDYIYRDYSEDGCEYISIMFEMKNEADTTATKKKNEDFFKELDKDRNEKKCEYAVLVSMLEPDSELYNAGIVDVSYKYSKMYVIRPQFFIPIITLLRNASLNSLKYRQELAVMKNQNIDIANFEADINDFKEKFSRNFRIASEKFHTAIEEIDKTIERLKKIKAALSSSEDNLRLANNKAEDLSIKKLTAKNPTMAKMFANLEKNEEASEA